MKKRTQKYVSYRPVKGTPIVRPVSVPINGNPNAPATWSPQIPFPSQQGDSLTCTVYVSNQSGAVVNLLFIDDSGAGSGGGVGFPIPSGQNPFQFRATDLFAIAFYQLAGGAAVNVTVMIVPEIETVATDAPADLDETIEVPLLGLTPDESTAAQAPDYSAFVGTNGREDTGALAAPQKARGDVVG